MAAWIDFTGVDLPAFFGIAGLIIATPGPDTALTIRNSLLGGWRSGLLTAAGVVTGQALWALATAAGLAGLLAASAPLFFAVKMLGAAYLVFLGVQAVRAACSPHVAAGLVVKGTGRHAKGRLRAYRQGVLNNLGNPKMAAFFPSLLPQFVPAHGGAIGTMLVLGLLFAAMTFAWLAVYAAVVARVGNILQRKRVRSALEGLTGAVLIGLGLRLAAEHR